MAQGLDGTFGPTLVDDACPESDGRSLLWLVVPVVLAIGWGIFFAYTAIYLADDTVQRPHRDSERAEARTEASAFVMMPEPARQPASLRPSRGLDRPASPAEPAATDAIPPDAAAAQPSSPVPAKAEPVIAVPAGIPRAADIERAEFVGLWGPTPAACQAPSRRHGYIPARITAGGARAGRTICTFRDGRRAGSAWVVAAECSDRGRRWSSQVRLTVDGDRLTWSSGKGASAYVRCGRRDG
ncbi:hypothetical protein ASG40_09085 [Methylobacterium sp. Leaf399]|uniref:hypothetical protein n=1 Tax=unclassified Methylobacterium TaxID=2615210 RepID=UPI0006F3AE43|nr:MULTISPECIES: hypothetical protein [unclassified Methylobacterium]KQP55143.1 hypothetical protein ASF39_05325 [Methylobacterium sp. Leaf108]KQT09882.1 hypothetical protein ASG40_09085 [Methylobacterium sp. Leaf399]